MTSNVNRRRIQYAADASMSRPGIIGLQETTTPPNFEFIQTTGYMFFFANPTDPGSRLRSRPGGLLLKVADLTVSTNYVSIEFTITVADLGHEGSRFAKGGAQQVPRALGEQTTTSWPGTCLGTATATCRMTSRQITGRTSGAAKRS